MTDLIIDISNNNGSVMFDPLPPQGVCGVYAKASQGERFTDKYFGANRAGARRNKLPFGAYHFFDPQADAARQAEHFCAIVHGLDRGDFKPVLDFETGGLDERRALKAIHDFGKVVKQRLGVYPIFYSYSAFLGGLGLRETVGNGLWLANYGKDDGSKEYPYDVPKPWKRVLLHQFTSKGRLHGINGNVDLNIAPHGLRPLLAHPWLARL